MLRAVASPQHHRHVGVTLPVDSGMDAVTEADVVRELVQLALDYSLVANLDAASGELQ
jgi:hypothetical protein